MNISSPATSARFKSPIITIIILVITIAAIAINITIVITSGKTSITKTSGSSSRRRSSKAAATALLFVKKGAKKGNPYSEKQVLSCRMILVLLVMLALLQAAAADDPFCEAGTATAPVDFLAKLKSFSADIYTVDMIKKVSYRAHERHSAESQRTGVFFYYDTSDQTRFLVYDEKTKMSTTNFMGGSCIQNSIVPNYGLIQWATGAPQEITYVGTETMAGEVLHNWRGCFTQGDIELSDDLYTTGFNTASSSPSGEDFIPVKMIRKSRKKSTQEESHIVHYFLRFETSKDDDDKLLADFQPPPGADCTDYMSGVSIPTLPEAITYFTEPTFNPHQATMYIIDRDQELIISQWRPTSSDDAILRIDSYKMGVMFQMPGTDDAMCSISPYAVLGDEGKLNQSLSYADSYMSVPFETVNHFIGEPEGFQFNGKQTVRGIPCYAYSKVYTNYKGAGRTTIILYFSAPGVKVSNNVGILSKTEQVLVRKEVWQRGALVYEDNIYDVGILDYSKLVFDPLDIKDCQEDLGVREFGVLFDSNSRIDEVPSLSYQQEEDLKSSLKTGLAEAAGVDILRIRINGISLQTGKLTMRASLFGAVAESAHIRDVKGSIPDSSLVPDNLRVGKQGLSYESCKQYALSNDKVVYGSVCDNLYDCTLYNTVPWEYLTVNDNCRGFFIGKNDKEMLDIETAWTNLVSAVESGKLDVKEYTASQISDAISSSEEDTVFSSVAKYEKLAGSRITTSLSVTSSTTLSKCATACTDSVGLKCEAFTFCEKTQMCMKNPNPDSLNREVDIQPDTHCDVYVRKYVTEFTSLEATSAVVNTELVYEMIKDPNDCARLCLNSEEFRCESFDFCTLDGGAGSGVCSLGREHFFDVAVAADTVRLPRRECVHYSRNYLDDYDSKEGVTNLPVAATIRKSSAESCAQTCSQESTSGEGACSMFQYCLIGNVCELIDESAVTSDAVRRLPDLKDKIGCYTYSLKRQVLQVHGRSAARRDDAVQALLDAPVDGDTGGQYGPGAMAGLAFAMLFLGFGLYFLGLYIWSRYRNPGALPSICLGRQKSDTNIKFSKSELDDD
ncbi:antigen b membrane protein [Plakobranchus ocellatus]|uniref:Antigen b membrane protein n=1 Tax=Plakobranchus ocellatus TaxID=259542 RepID=A0AAV4BK78_9GAST|nr:antigen b membrane protein [Plakobranchus ocellatus]